jgi:hypothetical protein
MLSAWRRRERCALGQCLGCLPLRTLSGLTTDSPATARNAGALSESTWRRFALPGKATVMFVGRGRFADHAGRDGREVPHPPARPCAATRHAGRGHAQAARGTGRNMGDANPPDRPHAKECDGMGVSSCVCITIRTP